MRSGPEASATETARTAEIPLAASERELHFAVKAGRLGIWSLAVPALASADFKTLAWILTGFLVASGLIGYIWAPRNEGKSLEQLEAERRAG